MEMFAAAGGLAFVLASLVLGARLVWMSMRTRGLPELVLGAGLFLMGGIGYPVMAVAQQATGLPVPTRIALVVVQNVCATVGMTGVALFTHRVFRPHASWAAVFVVAVASGHAAAFLGQCFGPGLLAFAQTQTGPWYASTCIGILVMVWAGSESLLYYLMQRRRLALGLADPVVADRFRLWTISMFGAATISIASTVLDLGFGIQTAGTTVGGLVIGPLGLVCSAALWLAFLPPVRYLDWVGRTAAA